VIKIRGSEKGGACSTRGRDEKCIHNIGWKSRREGKSGDDIVVDERIILK
jgi:hypothetical protein